MRYYIIAGEASGDIYGAELMAAIKQQDAQAEIRFWGGDLMKQHSDLQAMDYRKTAFMGFWEVIKNIGTIRQLFSYAKKDIKEFKPDRMIYIDYPGFNLRMADWTAAQGIHNSYFVAPQLWAWKKNRYKKIKRVVDQLFVILPFEKEFYAELGIKAQYNGHPLEAMIEAKEEKGIDPLNLSIGILPGSRQQELEKHLPIFKEYILAHPNIQFKIGLAPQVSQAQILALLGTHPDNLSFQTDTKKMIQNVDLAIVKSGTSTLETALIGTPQIVIYKTSKLSYLIGKRLINLKFISLVNLISNKEIVKELIQDEFTVKNLEIEIDRLLKPERLNFIKKSYQDLRKQLKGGKVFDLVSDQIIKAKP